MVVDPGDQNDIGVRPRKPRGLPHAKRADEGPSLFDQPPAPPRNTQPATRKTDPATSSMAAARAERHLRASQRDVLGVFRSYNLAMHDELLIEVYNGRVVTGARLELQTDSGLRSRRADLVKLGYVRDSGRKTTSAGGSPTTIWELTELGRAVAL